MPEIIDWLQAHKAVSAIGTTLVAIVTLVGKTWFAQHIERRRLKNALYREMADNFSRLMFLASPRDPNPPFARRRREYAEKMGLHGLAFALDVYNGGKSQASFQELAERATIEDFYGWLSRILAPRPTDDVVILTKEAVAWTVRQAQTRHLSSRLLTRSAPSYAKADVRNVLSYDLQILHDRWLKFGSPEPK